MAIMKPDQDTKTASTAPVAPAASADQEQQQQRRLAAAGYMHVAGAPEPLPLDLPQFSIKDLRTAIPAHCFERSLVRSLGHLAVNLAQCAALAVAATFIDRAPVPAPVRWVLWALYWFFQGAYLTGIWVIAHECGHQAYSDSEVVNNSIGLVLHSALLVPYHSWRISHRRHHSNTGSCENDEVFVPVSKSVYAATWTEHLEDSPLYNLYGIVMMLSVGWMPGYLFFNATGPAKYNNQAKSHFNPYAAMFNDRERWMVVLSDIFFGGAVVGLAWLTYQYSLVTMIKFYFVPYLIVNAFLVLITYLQHTDTYIPHFREGEWNWLRGALCTVDRSFGSYLDGVLHHIVDTHVCHHIFSKMPFYHAQEATEVLKPLLGRFYLKDTTPVPLALWRSYNYCKYVEDDGKIVFYKRKLHS
ncbi:TPA: hypothetical protein N0F65_012793 [Lagenidium giganteum]|uniref:Fatty acid desaturase domain-containing protein n=1 Tax=Lagenidium giganteum TaxID=4803 RepID=A0AAV2YGR5_9STRA|nr:TPA: hypothetical protein N0F65_012793 [Lagenidium giganteum]